MYKIKESELKHNNLYYAIAFRYISTSPFDVEYEKHEKWGGGFDDRNGYCEVVFWARLYDKPNLREVLDEDD